MTDNVSQDFSNPEEDNVVLNFIDENGEEVAEVEITQDEFDTFVRKASEAGVSFEEYMNIFLLESLR